MWALREFLGGLNSDGFGVVDTMNCNIEYSNIIFLFNSWLFQSKRDVSGYTGEGPGTAVEAWNKNSRDAHVPIGTFEINANPDEPDLNPEECN